MQLYSDATLNKGAGVFDHIMRSANEYRSYHKEMPTPVAIGVVAAGIASGLNEGELAEVINGYFNPGTAQLLQRVRDLYTGNDPRLHLWCRTRDGELKTHRWMGNSKPDWTIDRLTTDFAS